MSRRFIDKVNRSARGLARRRFLTHGNRLQCINLSLNPTSQPMLWRGQIEVHSNLTSGSGPDHVRIALKWAFPDTWPPGSKLHPDTSPPGLAAPICHPYSSRVRLCPRWWKTEN